MGYYNQQPSRGPVLAEEAMPDWQALQEQTRQGARQQQEQIRRASEQNIASSNKFAEETSKAFQAPAEGFGQFQKAQDRQQNRQAMAEESKQRQAQIAAMEQSNAIAAEFARPQAELGLQTGQAQLRGTKAGTRVAEQQAQKGEMEIASLTKWEAPGSAATMFPEAKEMIVKNNLPQDMSASEFLRVLGPKMDIEKFKMAKDMHTQQKEMFPLQVKALGQQIAAASLAYQQGKYTGDRMQLNDRIGDTATLLGSLEQKAATDKESASLLAQTRAQMDPKVAAAVDAEVKTRRSSSLLQAAIAEPTLDPLKYTGKQKTVADYSKVRDTAQQLNQLLNLKTQYEKASTLFYDNDEADALRGQMADIAESMGPAYAELATGMRRGVMSGTQVSTAMNRFVSIVGGQAIALGRDPDAAPETRKITDAMAKSLTLAGIPQTNATGHVESSGLAGFVRGGLNPGAKSGQTIPAQNTKQVPAGRLQQKYPNNRQTVPMGAINKGG